MIITLGDQGSHEHFQFKIGDKVRVKNGQITGTVIGGHCYVNSGLNGVYYKVKIRFGGSQSYRQGDIELVRVRGSL